MTCKFYKPDMDVLRAYCKCLYSLEGNGVGGYLHILLDDGNYTDSNILYCLDQCTKHPEWNGYDLGVLICKRYLDMSMNERSVFDDYLWRDDVECHSYMGTCNKNCRLLESLKDL